MKQSKGFRRLRAVAVSSALVLGGVGAAQAIIYTGSWDPWFGPSLPNLSFSGQAQFYIPDACIARGGSSASGFISNQSSCTSTGGGNFDPMRLVSAQVTLTDIRTGGPSEILNFTPSGPNAYTAQQLANFVLGVYIEFNPDNVDDGVLVGASTRDIGPVTGNIDASKTGIQPNDFYLRFGPGVVQQPVGRGIFALDASGSDDPSAPYRIATIRAVAAGGAASDAQPSLPAQVTFVPEPGSLALVLGALGLMGAVGVKRRR